MDVVRRNLEELLHPQMRGPAYRQKARKASWNLLLDSYNSRRRIKKRVPDKVLFIWNPLMLRLFDTSTPILYESLKPF